MISNSKDITIVVLSVRLYQRLLLAYPNKFQQKYGSDMVDVFRSCCLRAVRQDGTNGMVRLWAITLLDLIQSVLSEHAQKEVQLKREMKPEDIRLAGGALIWGAAAFVMGILLLGIRGSALWGFSVLLTHILSMPLLVVGILGVRNRYGDKVGSVGRNVLWMGAVLGSLLTFIGFFGLTYGIQSLQVMFIIGPAVLFAGLALFGFIALYKKPLPRWNIAPLIAGVWYPLLTFAYVTTSLRTGDWDGGSDPAWFGVVYISLLFVQGIALAALGYILKSDVPEETAIPA